MVRNEYDKKGAILGLHQPLEFEADTITLDIPMEGVAIKGWKITPLIPPLVSSCGLRSACYILPLLLHGAYLR